MVEIKNIPYITTDDVEELVKGAHWTEFEFAEMAENGSYQIVICNEEEVKRLHEDIEWENGKSSVRLMYLTNQLALVEALRDKLGVTDEILIFCYW